MQQEFLRYDVALDTQISCGQNSLAIRSNLSKPRRLGSAPAQLQWTSKIGIQYYLPPLELSLLIPYVAFAIYITVSIAVGTLVIYLTANQKQGTSLFSHLFQ